MKLKTLQLFILMMAFGTLYSQPGNMTADTQFRFNEGLNLRNLLYGEKIQLTGIQGKSLPDENKFEKHINNASILLDTNRYHPFYPEYNKKMSLLIPISEVIAINFGLGSFNCYVGGAEFAKISFRTVQHNLDTGFVWDDDVFVVNQFGHPYHGGLYFSTARSTGHNFWESIPFAFGGSLMWEMFMENDPPQTNDLIQTTIGGTMLGEMTYRLSSLVLDESFTGFKRLFHEIFGTVISPVRGFNRLLKGDMWRHTPKNVHDVYPLFSTIRLGYAGINPKARIEFEKRHLLFEYDLTYGNPAGADDIKPFDFFRLKIGFDTRKGDLPSSWVTAYGILYGKNFSSQKDRCFILGVYHDYDYFYNELYHLGLQSIGPGLIYTAPTGRSFKFAATFHTNLVALAALNSIYRKGESRDYDYCFGNKTMAEVLIGYGPVSLGIEYRLYILKTINGWPGNHTLGMLNPRLLVNIYGGIGVGIEYLFYHRFGKFEGVASYNRRISEQRLYLNFTM